MARTYEIDAALAREAEKAVLHLRGTDNQRGRWNDGFMPEDELCHLAREAAFLPFDGLPRFQRLMVRDVPHEYDRHPGTTGLVTFATESLTSMTHDEYEAFRVLCAAADAAVARWAFYGEHGRHFNVPVLDPRAHVARCEDCGKSKQRNSVLVTVRWEGRELTREYGLGGAR